MPYQHILFLVPWKLLKRETPVARKWVFVCPELSCIHHDPCHALGNLIGIKKHFQRKHNNQKHWVCDRYSKTYAVQSDYKAHLKSCGTHGLPAIAAVSSLEDYVSNHFLQQYSKKYTVRKRADSSCPRRQIYPHFASKYSQFLLRRN